MIFIVILFRILIQTLITMEVQKGNIVPGLNSSIVEIIKCYKSAQGYTKEYDILCSYLSRPEIQDGVLLVILKELKLCVTLLGKDLEGLVGIILKIEWLDRNEAVQREYQSFIVNLVSSNTLYLRTCLQKFVKSFSPALDKTCEDETTIVPTEKREADDGKFMKLHKLLNKIVNIVPMTHSVLLPLLEECYPFIKKDAYIHECYVKNLLHMSSYLPSHRRKILEIIVDRMSRLDVRTPREELHMAEGDSDDENLEDEIFDMDEFKSGCSLSAKAADDALIPMAHKNAGCLDALMELMFLYIQDNCFQNGKLQWEATKKVYKDMLQIFDCIILPTHASCHVQFLMFYIISYHDALVEGFIDYLLKKVQDPNSQPIFRQAAVAYLASLVARAQYISVAHIKSVLELLTAWIHRYVQHVGDGPYSHASLAHHGPFYSVCQAVFYIFAFRLKELQSMPNGSEFFQSLNLQTIVTSRLNPLKVCLPIVANTFSSIARSHQLAFCDTIMERNKRNQLPIAGSDTSSTASTVHTHFNPLDSFFPFDPYLLNRSGKFITPLYKEYEGNPVEDSDHSDSEEDFMETDVLKEENSLKSDFHGGFDNNTDLLMYGTSPGFKTTLS